MYRLGIVEYMQVWDLQKQISQKVAEGEHEPTLILLEHSHVYTFGKSGNQENLIWGDEKLEEKKVDVHWIDRGGDVTYHGPGQLVGYPIIPLMSQASTDDGRRVDLTGYLRRLEKVIIKTLADIGVVSGQINGQTGVWVQPDVLSKCVNCPRHLYKAPAKIASIGVKVDARGITRHGFAININTDMSYFEGILACGLENQNKAKLSYFLENPPSMDDFIERIATNFGMVFNYEMQEERGVILQYSG